jgi:hypothetical protein
MDTLQQQQEHADARRLAAEQAAVAAQAEQAALKGQLHEALRRAAELDDQEQAVQIELDARLLEQAQQAEQLRCAFERAEAPARYPGMLRMLRDNRHTGQRCPFLHSSACSASLRMQAGHPEAERAAS